MTRADLRALAARCEAAQGADRELDEEIALAVGWERRDFGSGEDEWRAPGYSWHATVAHCPDYTSSLDAAASLVPEGWTVERVMQSRGSHQWLCSLRAKAVRADSIAATEPLARTAAALRARAAEMEDEG